MTYTCDRHTFNYLAHAGFVFLAVADQEFGRQVPFAFLERLHGQCHGRSCRCVRACVRATQVLTIPQ